MPLGLPALAICRTMSLFPLSLATCPMSSAFTEQKTFSTKCRLGLTRPPKFGCSSLVLSTNRLENWQVVPEPENGKIGHYFNRVFEVSFSDLKIHIKITAKMGLIIGSVCPYWHLKADQTKGLGSCKLA